MIEGTYLEELIDRAFDGLEQMIGFDKPSRGREEDGTFKADDPSTPSVNEAWESGKSPKKITKKVVKNMGKITENSEET